MKRGNSFGFQISSFLLTLVAAISVTWGCAGRVYYAAKLPPEFAAPPVRPEQIALANFTQSAVDSDVLQAGDLIEVSVATGLEPPETWSVLVASDGSVHLPLIGTVSLAGLEAQAAGQVIREASIRRNLYRDPQVSVYVKSRKINKVTVMGAVEKPGSYDLPVANSDLLTALAVAGGMSEEADAIVELRHPPRERLVALPPLDNGQAQLAGYKSLPEDDTGRLVRVDLRATSEEGKEDWRLEDGSVVMVMKKQEQNIYVMGLVRKPNQFELPAHREIRLLDALAMAGGRTLEIADKVRIIRTMSGDSVEPVIIQASVREAKKNIDANLRLAAGDVVSVEETPLTFTLDTLRSFIRFGFSSAIPGF